MAQQNTGNVFKFFIRSNRQLSVISMYNLSVVFHCNLSGDVFSRCSIGIFFNAYHSIWHVNISA